MNKKTIRIHGVTIAKNGASIRAYGYGRSKYIINEKEVFIEYVDYFVEDLIGIIKKQNLSDEIIKKLSEK